MQDSISINVLSLKPASFAAQIESVIRIGAGAITPDVTLFDDMPSSQAGRLVRDAGLRVAALTHRAFGFADEDETTAARERLARSINFAHDIGATTIVMTTGSRGGLGWREAANRFADAIAPCAELARAGGLKLGIEPTSHLYADASMAHRLTDTLALARVADISVTIDLFACWVDADIEDAIADAGSHTALVQVSDYVYGDRALPCRAVPGDGAIPLDRLIPAIVRSGYNGTFDLEIIGPRRASGDTEGELNRAARHIGNILNMVED